MKHPSIPQTPMILASILAVGAFSLCVYPLNAQEDKKKDEPNTEKPTFHILPATQFDAAQQTFEEAARLRRSELVAGHWSVALVRSLRGECLTALARYEEARPCLVESCARLAATFGPEHRLSREARSRLERLDEARNPPR